ncbi:glycosyltransferase [Streptomyces sp. NPDC058319]|uniref:glycosyltransferase n=1 Tax=unclassified Streptomyces TaxID=2593676 RepID=UPI0036ECCA88
MIAPQSPGAIGGSDMHVLDLAKYQKSVGMQPIVIERGSHLYAERLRALGIEVVSASQTSFFRAIRNLSDTIRSSNAQLVHAHGYDADYWAATTRWVNRRLFRDRPLIFTQHGVVEDTLRNKAKTALDALCIRTGAGVIVCAAELVPRMERWCPGQPVAYIPNGVGPFKVPSRRYARDELAHTYNTPSSPFLLGFVGRLSPEKCPHRVIEMTASLRDTGVDVHAFFAGSGPLRRSLEELADRLGISDAVTFAGLINDMGTVYGALDALALLSDTEATPRVVIEAMSARVPVVATDVGSVREMLGDGRLGLLVPRDDATAAIKAMREVLLGPPPQFIDAAQEYALTQHCADRMGMNVQLFYDAIFREDRRNVVRRA